MLSINAAASPVCHNIDSISMCYSKYVTSAWLIKNKISARAIEIKFHDDTIANWDSDYGNLVLNGFFEKSGCGVKFSKDGETCSAVIWDENSNCLISGISTSFSPVIVIRNFGRTNDIGFVFFDVEPVIPIKQIMIYRPGIGAIYSRKISGFDGILATKEEFILDSFYINSKMNLFKKEVELRNVLVSIEKVIPWIKHLEPNDVAGGIRRIHWNDLILR